MLFHRAWFVLGMPADSRSSSGQGAAFAGFFRSASSTPGLQQQIHSPLSWSHSAPLCSRKHLGYETFATAATSRQRSTQASRQRWVRLRLSACMWCATSPSLCRRADKGTSPQSDSSRADRIAQSSLARADLGGRAACSAVWARCWSSSSTGLRKLAITPHSWWTAMSAVCRRFSRCRQRCPGVPRLLLVIAVLIERS